MPTVVPVSLTIARPMRSVSDDGWEEIDAVHIAHWSSAATLLRSRSYVFGAVHIVVEFDWRPLLRRLRKHYKLMEDLLVARNQPEAHQIGFPTSSVRIPGLVTAATEKKEFESSSFLLTFAQSFIHDVFLVMNIAAPGSCNLYKATVEPSASHPPWQRSHMSLSEINFDIAYLNGREGSWPAPTVLPLDTVADWYWSIRCGASQVPESGMEKVLFALLHIAGAGASENTVIWIFYGLEALFETRPGENFRVLTERLELLLIPSTKESKGLRKKLRKLYNLRSAFAHGGLQVAHPMHNEVLDPRAESGYASLLRSVEFGFALLLVSLQKIIAKGWREPSFKETLSGVPIVPKAPSEVVYPC